MTHAIWRCFYRSQEKAGVGEDVEIHHSVWYELPILFLFIGKIVCVIAAYVAIFVFLVGNLLKPHA